VGVILDTSVLVASERRALRLDEFLRSLGPETVGMAAITASEMLHGWHRASDAAVRARRAAFVEALLDLLPVYPFALPEARRHAELRADLAREGRMIGPHDMLIGATALARGDAVATLNGREFSRIPGLRLVALEGYRS
jgi:predicted nucleic acid-binding protein